jgi:protein-tyrosine phosphatase
MVVEFGKCRLWLGGKQAQGREWAGICNCAEEIALEGKGIHIMAQDEIEYAIRPHFPEGETFLRKALQEEEGDFLFMCAKGISRSSTILISALMSVKKMSLRECWLLVKSKRPRAMPNPR